MNPKAQGPHDEGFLEYLEDIIGTNKYLENINESHKQLQSLNEKRSGVMKMVKLADKERDNLEAAKNEAESYMLKELLLLKWKERAAKFSYDDNATKIAEIQKSASDLEERITSEREKMQEKQKELNEAEMLHTNNMKRQEELDTVLKRSYDEFKKLERQEENHQRDLKLVKRKVKEIDEEVEKDLKKIKEITKQSEELAINLIPQLEGDITRLQKNLLDEDKLLDELVENSKDETKPFRIEVEKVRAELKPLLEQLNDRQRELAYASIEKKRLLEKHEASSAAYLDAQKKMGDIQMTLISKNSSIKDMQTKLEKNKLESLKASKLEIEQEELMTLEHAARLKFIELRSVLETERDQGSVLRAILQAKASNEIQGIYGRLGDLGAIDGKYDVAISTACPGLDYIVVETIAAAEACGKLLRNNKIGLATFMALEQVQHMSRLKEKVDTPEGVPRLFDLIKVKDERMKLAFFQALGNTVVSKDMDQATRIAYGVNKEFRRVVTVKGELIETSGVMTGGGNKPSGGKMGTSIRDASVSREAVADAENEVNQISKKLENIRLQISQAANYNELEKKVKQELAKIQIEIETLKSQHQDLAKQLDSLKAEAEPSNDELTRLEELTKIISEKEKEIKILTEGSNHLKEKILELQSKIENAKGERLKNIQKEKINKIQNDIDIKSQQIIQHNVQIKKGQKTLKELTNGIEESNKVKEKLISQEENLLSTFKEIEQKTLNAKDDYKKTEELIDQHKDELGKAKSDYEILKKTVNEMQAFESDADDKLEDMKKISRDLEMKEKRYKEGVENLKSTLSKHMEQIQKDLVDPLKLQATLEDETFSKDSDPETALEMVALLDAQLQQMNPNLDSISDYWKKVAMYEERVKELNLVTNERDETKRSYDGWRKKRLEEFMTGFSAISLKLKEMYQMITLRGDAELELVDSLDPFSEGVVFSVRPPKKSWKNVSNLSGGEKTLSSLALVFALHYYKPSPLYVMDEIDAALDFKNVSIVGHYVKHCAKDAQFIIISLRNIMFELADGLVGIYKTDNCTKSITINPRGFVVS